MRKIVIVTNEATKKFRGKILEAIERYEEEFLPKNKAGAYNAIAWGLREVKILPNNMGGSRIFATIWVYHTKTQIVGGISIAKSYI